MIIHILPILILIAKCFFAWRVAVFSFAFLIGPYGALPGEPKVWVWLGFNLFIWFLLFAPVKLILSQISVSWL